MNVECRLLIIIIIKILISKILSMCLFYDTVPYTTDESALHLSSCNLFKSPIVNIIFMLVYNTQTMPSAIHQTVKISTR